MPSIRVVSNRTGIGPHTLRVWERRYGFPQPERRTDGVRAYAEEDVARLKLIARALEAGFRAGEVVPLPVADLERLLGATLEDVAATRGSRETKAAVSAAVAPDLEGVLAALGADDVVAVQSLLRAAARELGPKRFVTTLVHPLVLRIGQLWSEKKLEIRHEHLASACLTRQLHALLHEEADGARAPVVVLATLPGERHVLPLDMVAVYLSASGAAPRMLGADAPPADIAASARQMRADAVGLSVSAVAEPEAVVAQARSLLAELPRRTELWLGGARGEEIAAAIGAPGVFAVTTWAALDARL